VLIERSPYRLCDAGPSHTPEYRLRARVLEAADSQSASCNYLCVYVQYTNASVSCPSLHRPLLTSNDSIFKTVILHTTTGNVCENLQVLADKPAAEHELNQLKMQACRLLILSPTPPLLALLRFNLTLSQAIRAYSSCCVDLTGLAGA